MKKEDLIFELSKKMNIRKIFAKDYIDTVFEMISEGLSESRSFILSGFGTFLVKKRSARTYMNPKTRAKVYVEEKNIVQFIPSKKLLNKIK